MNHKPQRAAMGLGLLLCAVGAAHGSNLIHNGSFEDVVGRGAVVLPGVGTDTDTSNGIDNGKWAVFSSLPGIWSVNSGPGIEVRNNIAGTAQHGSNFVELDSHGGDPSNSFMQQIFHGSGTQYLLSFWYAARPGSPGSDPNSNGIQVWWNGGVLTAPPLTPGDPGGGTTDTNWRQYSAVLTGNVGSNVLGFRAVGIDETYGGSLDNVVVSVVPEAEAYALALAGMGVVGVAGIGRRRRRG